MKTFICAMCGCVGDCRPEEEAEVELKENFGPDVKKEDCVNVCDECWEKIRPSNNKEFF